MSWFKRKPPPAEFLLINAYSTLISPPPPPFAHNQRDRTDPELTPHLGGFIQYVLGTQPQMTATLYSVMRHLERVQHQFSLEVADTDLAAFLAWAGQANAVYFYPDGSVRDPAGRVLVSPDSGQLDPAAQVPYPADALARKDRSTAQLQRLGIQVPVSLPPVVGEGEVRWRTPQEVARRTVALAAVAVLAESRAEGEPLAHSVLDRNLPGCAAFLSPAEQAYLAEQQPSEQQNVNFGWRYESLSLLNWALGLMDELPFPDQICDVPLTASLARETANKFDSPQLQPAPDLLDALDLHFRLHWAVVDARINNREAPQGIIPGVILERHYALNWLTRFEDNDWDEVDTPT